MAVSNRRAERRNDIVDALPFKKILNLAGHEEKGSFLEGTGSMVLDHRCRVAYAALSPRTHQTVLDDFAKKMGYTTVTFHSIFPDTGAPIYHTNVLMAVGERNAIVCFDVIPNPEEQQTLRSGLASNSLEIVEITLDQMKQFAGNLILLKHSDGQRFWVMSQQAKQALDQSQKDMLTEDGTKIISSDIHTIELAGGGSARCTLTEVFSKMT